MARFLDTGFAKTVKLTDVAPFGIGTLAGMPKIDGTLELSDMVPAAGAGPSSVITHRVLFLGALPETVLGVKVIEETPTC